MVETRGGRRFAALFLVAAFIILLAGRWLRPVDTVAETAVAPFASVASRVAGGISGALGGIFNAGQLQSENEVLKRQNAKLVRQLISYQATMHDAALLKSMLKFEDANSHMDFLPGRVIWRDPTGIPSYIDIDKGSRDGLKAGMTVLDQNGYFVGTVSDIWPNGARVLLMQNPSSSVAALDLTTRASGLVEGNLSGPPQFSYVLTGEKLRTNDLVVTSGQMNLFPRNLLIGQIIRVSHRTDQLFQSVDVRPAADIQHLEMVQVIRNWVPSAPVQLP